MTRNADIIDFLESFAPTGLAEDWDNVGLLVGHSDQDVTKVMTCLTLTSDVAAESVQAGAGLVVAHHPLLFRPIQQLTSGTAEGRMLLDLIKAGIAVYSPHTGYDSAPDGINQQLAELLELTETGVLRPSEQAPDDAGMGAGRFGKLASPEPLDRFMERVKTGLRVQNVQFVGDPATPVEWVAVACGSAAECLKDADAHGCQVLLTGEARFHACLEARTRGIALVLPGHYATERPAMERLAEVLSSEFPDVEVWASQSEADPLQWN